MALILQLYVSEGSPGSMRAIENLRRICLELGERFENVEIIDVRCNMDRAERDRVLATPTLIKCEPLPKLRIIGDLSDRAKVLAALGI